MDTVLSQLGGLSAFCKEMVWTWVDGKLFLPEQWFISEWQVNAG